MARKLEVEFVGDTKDLDRAFGKASSGANKTGGKFKAFGKIAAVGIGGGLLAAGVALKGFVQAASESQVSTSKMQTQLKALGISYNKHSDHIDKVISKHSALSGLDDEDLQDSFTNIVRVTGDVNEALKLNALAADIARARGIDLAAASKFVAKAAGGQETAFSRVGIVMKEGATAQEAIAEAQKKFGGQAEAYGKTAAGAQERFGVAVENLQEALGEKLLPMVTTVANAVAGFVNGMQTGDGAGGKFVSTIKGIAASVRDVIDWFQRGNVVVAALVTTVGLLTLAWVALRVQAIAQMIPVLAANTAAWIATNVAMLANPAVLITAGLIALAAGLVVAYRESETFRAIVDTLFAGLRDGVVYVVNFFTEIDKIPAKAKAAGNAILHGIVDGIKALPDALFDAAKWILTTWVAGVKLWIGSYVSVGGWILARVIDGVRALPDVIFAAGKWLLLRMVDGIKLWIGSYLLVGQWVLHRIIDGFKVVTELLATVGIWLKNRFVEFVHGTIESYLNLGSWVVNRVVDGFKTVTEALGNVGTWLFHTIRDLARGVKDEFIGVGASIIGWIVDGLKSGANLLVEFLNAIIGVINKLPGVNIGKIEKFKEGGKVKELAGGGAFARTGGKVGTPMALMGEEAPRWPEYVIPTNPAYRRRAQDLIGQAGKAIGLETGGIWSIPAMAQLWLGQGGAGSVSDTMGVIGFAESRGDQYARNPSGATGLWQILGQLVPGDLMDAKVNARNAIAKYKLQGLHAWDASRHVWEGLIGETGQGPHLGDIVEFLNPADLIGKLPGVGNLPDWLKGTGKWLLERMGSFIKDEIGGALGFGNPDWGPDRKIKAMLRFADHLDSLDIPYGPQGHAGWAINRAGEDCSSTVSKVLHAAGYLASVLTTVGLPGALARGPGKYVTVHNRALAGASGHTIIQLGERFFGTSGSNPGGGPGWFPHPGGGYLSTMPTKLHPAGLRQGGVLPFVGSYGHGGVLPADGMYYGHRGEIVGQPTFDVHLHFASGMEWLREHIRVEIRESERTAAGQFKAGIVTT